MGGNRATIRELAQKMQRREAPPPPIGRLLGFVLQVIEPGRAVFEMEAAERHHNSMGTPHGGRYCDLANAALRRSRLALAACSWGVDHTDLLGSPSARRPWPAGGAGGGAAPATGRPASRAWRRRRMKPTG